LLLLLSVLSNNHTLMSTGVADHQVRLMRDVMMFYYRDFDISNIRFFN
jgi:hypothetical protein